MDSRSAGDLTLCLRPPWLKHQTFLIRKGKYRLVVYDQPGRWMSEDGLAKLTDALFEIGRCSMDEVPTYGVFTGDREAYRNRVIGVISVAATDEPVAFTAMVYLPVTLQGRVEPVIHLGLTMIKQRFRGHRLQLPLFERLFFLPALNQFRVRWIVTSIAASPAGIGSVSDYFEDPYPAYHGSTRRKPYHVEVARKLLTTYRHEFGCAATACFNPETFVVAGSNDPNGGGAFQFIRADPVSRYRQEACNGFCSERLLYARGDELFQVARLNLFRGVVGLINRRGARLPIPQ